MAKRLSKTLWYGTDVDATGQPLLPPATTNPGDLDGLHKGELFMHLAEDEVTLWGVSSNGKVVKITGKSDESNIDLSDYLKKEVWDSVWEIRQDTSGQKYIYGKLPVVTQYGVTMYADNGSLDIPSIYAGLPIDNNTLVRDTNGVLMINPNLDLGSGGGASSWDELEGIPSWIGATKPTYEYSEIENTPDLSKYVSSDDLSKYVTLGTEQTITGKKDFTTGGLFVNGKQIQYDATNGCWKLEGNLLVTGGVTMYADGTTSGGSSAYSTLGSLLNVDDSIDASASVDRVLFQAAGSSEWITKPLSEIGGSVSGDYLPLSGGDIKGNTTIYNDENSPLAATFYIRRTPSVISYKDAGGNILGYIGFGAANEPCVYDSTGSSNSKNTIWHSGNDGNGSGLDADMLDGYQWDSFYIKGINNVYNHGKSIGSLTAVNSDANAWNHYLNVNLKLVSNNNAMALFVSDIQNDRRAMIQVGHNSTNYAANTGELYLNPLGGAVYIGSVEAATINSNVASATKLKTARTIWGQSFDGSGNVSGDLFLTNNNYIYSYDNKGSHKNILGLSATNNLHVGNGSSEAGYTTSIHGNVVHLRYGTAHGYGLTLSSSGDIGIGTTSPLYKLDVRGAMMCQLMRFNSYSDSSKEVGYIGRGSPSANNLIFYASDGELRFYSNNNTSAYMKFASLNLTVPGGITMYSDRRKKTILNHVELSLKQIADAPLIEHYYNSDQAKTTHVGSIAQYWAGLNDWFCKKDEEGFYTMEIQNAALASAISIARHLERYETKTDKKIRQLKKRISQLEDEIELLKKGAQHEKDME